jgi:hypothetical protein
LFRQLTHAVTTVNTRTKFIALQKQQAEEHARIFGSYNVV